MMFVVSSVRAVALGPVTAFLAMTWGATAWSEGVRAGIGDPLLAGTDTDADGIPDQLEGA